MYFSMFDWTREGGQWAWTPRSFRGRQHQEQLPQFASAASGPGSSDMPAGAAPLAHSLGVEGHRHAHHPRNADGPRIATGGSNSSSNRGTLNGASTSTSNSTSTPPRRPHRKKGHKRKDSDIVHPMTYPDGKPPQEDESAVVLLEAPANTIHVDGNPHAAPATSSVAASSRVPHAVLAEAPLSPSMHRRHSNPSAQQQSTPPASHAATAKASSSSASPPTQSIQQMARAAANKAGPVARSHSYHSGVGRSIPTAATAAAAGTTTMPGPGHAPAQHTVTATTATDAEDEDEDEEGPCPAADCESTTGAAALMTSVWLALATFVSSLAPAPRAGGEDDADSVFLPHTDRRVWPWRRSKHGGSKKHPLATATSSAAPQVHHRARLSSSSARAAAGGKVYGLPRSCRGVGKVALVVVLLFLVVQVGLYLSMSGSCSAQAEDEQQQHPQGDAVRPPIVEYYIHGHGRGHASRGKTVIEALERVGYKVCVFVDDHVADLVRTVGAETVSVKSLPIANSAHSVWETLKIFVFRYLTDADCSICDRARHNPDLVISDGDFPGVWRASRAGIPAIALGHGYLFSTTEKPDHVSGYAWGHQEVLNGRTTRLAQCTVDVSFVPLTPLNSNSTIVAKPRLRDSILRTKRVQPPKKMVVVYFRDHGSGQRIFEELKTSGFEVRAFGPQRLETPYVSVRAFNEEDFITSMSEASAVIASSGDNLIAECMWLGIPMMAMYDAVDSEQMLNAEMFERTGLGVASSFQSFTPDRLRSFLDQLPQFEARAQQGQLASWDAPDTIDATLECVQRVSPVAQKWHSFASGADDEVNRRRRHLSQLARAI